MIWNRRHYAIVKKRHDRVGGYGLFIGSLDQHRLLC